MDVPFVSSGAMSRAHYALVRKVETASSTHAADLVLSTEVDAIQKRLLHSTLTMKQVKESLVILLYCSTAVSPSVALDVLFALPHAISLAEAGQRIQDKRIGYLFCVETMPQNHELQLMLVNTLRKDLESHELSRICLALDTLLHFAPEDVAPAVQDRLYELLSHHSSHIRRRAMLVCRVLAGQNPDILKHITNKIQRRLGDSDATVVSAALTVALDLVAASLLSRTTYHTTLSRLLQSVWKARNDHARRWLLLKILQGIQLVRPSADDLAVILEIVGSGSWEGASANAIKYQCFLAAGSHSETTLSFQPSAGSALIQGVRHLLTSDNVNDIYTFLCCLACLEAKLWAGTTPDIPAVLESWEVERIMHLLESNDSLIRRKTLHLLLSVDRGIVEAYYAQLLSDNFSSLRLGENPDAIRKPIEVIELLSGGDGELYAQQCVQMLQTIEGDTDHDKTHVLEVAMEDILIYIRNANIDVRSGSLGVLFTILDDQQKPFGPTLATILAALICEYLESSPISPTRLLSGLARMLPSYSAAVQDACLLSMMRVAAGCDEIPDDTIQIVRKVQERAGRHIRRRCDQFLKDTQDNTTLKQVVSRARSHSLPDFLVALETYGDEKVQDYSNSQLPGNVVSPERPSSRASSSTPSRLRYAAYEAPRPTSRLRRLSSSSSRSTAHSETSYDNEELLARTVTAGDLALAAGRSDLEELSRSPPSITPNLPAVQIVDEDELASRVDLITLDSPFVSEPSTSVASIVTEPGFESIWNGLANTNARGWCESSIDTVVRKLQGIHCQLRVTAADQPPFPGDLKILITPPVRPSHPGQGIAVLRLRESDDESCLWHLRCEDEELRKVMKTLLEDAQ